MALGKGDFMVGKSKKSRLASDAVREKLRQEALIKALKESAGTLTEEDYPEWATSEKLAAWVRKLRQGG